MKKPNGFERNAKKQRKFLVFLNAGTRAWETTAVSPEKAINNVRYSNFIQYGNYDYSMDDFDCLEIL